MVHPLHARIRDNDEQVDKRRKLLQSSGYPLDSALLEKELGHLKRRIEGGDGEPGIKATSEAALVQATRTFMERIVTGHRSPDMLRQHAARALFQDHFSRIAIKLAERGTHLAPTVLGISDESSSPYIYQLILQAWTVERFADLAEAEGLVIATVGDTEVEHGGRKVKAADIRLLPVRGYTLGEEDKTPYLVEFPVQATLLGDLPQIKSFLRKLTAGGNFLPATHVEIYTDDPGLPVYHDGQRAKVDKVRVRVRCSSFLVLGLPGVSAGSPVHLPTGA